MPDCARARAWLCERKIDRDNDAIIQARAQASKQAAVVKKLMIVVFIGPLETRNVERRMISERYPL